MSIKRLLFALLMSILATSIQAETINCTPITSVPATITAQGIYCLTGNVATSQTSGNAIEIDANNVTLDLNGWKVGGQAAGAGTNAYGIYSAANNVTIKNGIVRGFYVGIYLGGSGDVVQDMLADTNYYVSIWTTGPGALVDHNQVVNSGNSANSNGNVWGIATEGASATVNNNVVSGLTSTGTGNEYGIGVYAVNSTVRNNIISNSALPSGGGASFGVYQDTSIALNNTVNDFNYGIYGTGGIYAYNTVNNCSTPFNGGTAGAGNSND